MSLERSQFFRNLDCEVNEDIIDDVVDAARKSKKRHAKSDDIKLGPFNRVRFILCCSGSEFTIVVFKNGMRRFSGKIDADFRMNGKCTFYINGIKSEEGEFKNGKKNGKFTEYDSGNEKSIEFYENDVKKSAIIVKNSIRYIDRRSSGTRYYGECILVDKQAKLHGRVIEYENDKEKQISHFESDAKKRVLAEFKHENSRDIMIEYSNYPTIHYVGEYQLNRDSLTYTYEGFGMFIEYHRNKPMCVYRGSFRNNRRDGFGCSFDPKTGLKDYEGEWKDDVQTVGKTFVDGEEREISIKTIKDIREFPKTQYKLSFHPNTSGDLSTFNLNEYDSIKNIQEIEFKTQSFELLERLIIRDHPSLKVLTIEDNTFAKLKQLSVIKCLAFTTLIVGDNCLNALEKLNLEYLPQLDVVTIGSKSLITCSVCILYRIPNCTFTIDPTSLTSLSTLVSSSSNKTFLSQFTTISTPKNTSYTISDFNSVSKEYCRELILEKDSFPHSYSMKLTDYVDLEYLKFEEGSYPCLDSFRIVDTLSRLERIIIDSNCACSPNKGMGDFALKDLSSLREVIIDDGSFISYINFSIQNCPSLKVVRIGRKKDIRNILELKDSLHSFKLGRKFTIESKDCKVLEELSIHGCCFTSRCDASIRECPLLSTFSVGSLCFCNCHSLVLYGLNSLQRIDSQPFAFYRCESIGVKSCHPDLVMVTSSTDHFKGMKKRELDRKYPIWDVINSCIVNEDDYL